MDNAAYILSLSVSDFRKFKVAQRHLWSVGISSEDAIEMLVNAHQRRQREREREQRTMGERLRVAATS